MRRRNADCDSTEPVIAYAGEGESWNTYLVCWGEKGSILYYIQRFHYRRLQPSNLGATLLNYKNLNSINDFSKNRQVLNSCDFYCLLNVVFRNRNGQNGLVQ